MLSSKTTFGPWRSGFCVARHSTCPKVWQICCSVFNNVKRVHFELFLLEKVSLHFSWCQAAEASLKISWKVLKNCQAKIAQLTTLIMNGLLTLMKIIRRFIEFKKYNCFSITLYFLNFCWPEANLNRLIWIIKAYYVSSIFHKGGPVEERLYKKTWQYSKFEFSLSKTES